MHVLKISLWGHENICDPKRLDENKAGKPGLGSSWRSVPSSETVIEARVMIKIMYLI